MKSNPIPQTDLRKWNRRVRAWILRVHPEEKKFIYEFDKNITFEEVWQRMNQGEDFYEICRCTESAQRELVFGELANLLGCDYADIYDTWLHG